mmetsp:Transcript_30805/g.85980  ORF Transcript_30805/g.85980 Transcript_30805/m.85980 type:complete len:380 (-) Transcript_30805:102-1241(-)
MTAAAKSARRVSRNKSPSRGRGGKADAGAGAGSGARGTEVTPSRRRPNRSPSKRTKRRRAAGAAGGSASSDTDGPTTPAPARSGSPLAKLPLLSQLVLTPAPEPSRGRETLEKLLDSEKKGPRVTIAPRAAKQITVALITATMNNQGVDKGAAYCLAAVAGRHRDGSPRLIRLVPDIGHFWSDDMLPQELRDMHAKRSTALPGEPHWPFSPVVVGFQAGTLPDAVTGPHRRDDIVARKLHYLGPVEDKDLLGEQLSRIAVESLVETWPSGTWATSKALLPDADVPSLAIFAGRVKWVHWRDIGSPQADIIINGKEVQRVPYAAHRLHDLSDKGYAMLSWFQEQPSCLLLLGLSRTFIKDGFAPQCPILLLRVFPDALSR